MNTNTPKKSGKRFDKTGEETLFFFFDNRFRALGFIFLAFFFFKQSVGIEEEV